MKIKIEPITTTTHGTFQTQKQNQIENEHKFFEHSFADSENKETEKWTVNMSMT